MPGRCCSGGACSAAASSPSWARSRNAGICGARSAPWAGRAGRGRAGAAVAVCSAVAPVCFLNAMRLTAVADVMVIDAAIPFVTAALAWLILGERENAWTLGATLVAFIGMAVMAGPAIAHGRVLG